jgi:hypothetical protein
VIAALAIINHLFNGRIFGYTLIELPPVLSLLPVMQITKLRASFLSIRSDSDNGKTMGKGPRLQAQEAFI